MRDADLYDPSSNFVGAGGIGRRSAIDFSTYASVIPGDDGGNGFEIIKAQIRCRLTRARNTGSPNPFAIHPLEGSLVRDSMHHC